MEPVTNPMDLLQDRAVLLKYIDSQFLVEFLESNAQHNSED